MAWVIFVCWCAGAIWTGSDDRIHFARPFGPFIARNVSTSVRPSKRKGHGFAWPESLESAAGRNFWWLHYLLINCLTKINNKCHQTNSHYFTPAIKQSGVKAICSFWLFKDSWTSFPLDALSGPYFPNIAHRFISQFFTRPALLHLEGRPLVSDSVSKARLSLVVGLAKPLLFWRAVFRFRPEIWKGLGDGSLILRKRKLQKIRNHLCALL